jgi:hypothetical protein
VNFIPYNFPDYITLYNNSRIIAAILFEIKLVIYFYSENAPIQLGRTFLNIHDTKVSRQQVEISLQDGKVVVKQVCNSGRILILTFILIVDF